MNNLKLYEITNAFPMIIEQEEMSDEEKKKLEEELTVLLQQKSQSIIGYIRNLELTVEAMKEEEKRLSERRKQLEKQEQKIKEYTKECMEKAGIDRVETALGTLSVFHNPISVEIKDMNLIPDEFKEKVVTVKVNKIAIKSHLKNTGEIIPGVEIIDNATSLRVK